MQVISKLRYARISPQKCRLVADVVRGRPVGHAIATLRYMPKKGAQLVRKVLESAVANAEHNHGADIDELKVALIHVDERHLQLVDVGAVVVLGVGDRGLERLAHELRTLLRHVAQRCDRMADRAAAHYVRDQPALLRGNARVTEFGNDLHELYAAPSGGGGLHLAIARVRLEGAGRGELAELVAHHVLADQHGNVLAAVVDGDGDAHHLRHYHGAARPGLDRLAVVLGGGHLHLPGEVQVDERAFLQRAWHTGLD